MSLKPLCQQAQAESRMAQQHTSRRRTMEDSRYTTFWQMTLLVCCHTRWWLDGRIYTATLSAV